MSQKKVSVRFLYGFGFDSPRRRSGPTVAINLGALFSLVYRFAEEISLLADKEGGYFIIEAVVDQNGENFSSRPDVKGWKDSCFLGRRQDDFCIREGKLLVSNKEVTPAEASSFVWNKFKEASKG